MQICKQKGKYLGKHFASVYKSITFVVLNAANVCICNFLIDSFLTKDNIPSMPLHDAHLEGLLFL